MMYSLELLLAVLLSSNSSHAFTTRHHSFKHIHSTKLHQETASAFNIDVETDGPKFQLEKSLPECDYTQVMSTNDLEPISIQLRQYYDEHFKDPRQPDSNRFMWDPWYVNVGDVTSSQEQSAISNDEEFMIEGEKEATEAQTQYSLKRIQSNNFFTDDDFSNLVEELTALGRSVGLTAITPPWISMYTNGDMQNLHTDAPHGPLAFVLSLSNEGDFQGGETIMLKSKITDLWKGFDGSVGMETGNIMRYIPSSPLGRCIVFDPRVPHGVNLVQSFGNDPRKGRIAIHGWFNQPEVCWFGSWDETQVENMNTMLDEALQPIVETLASGEIGRVCGYLACRIEIDEDGDVDDVIGVCDTLKADPEDFRGVIGYDEADRPVFEDAPSDIKLTIFENLKNLNFGEGSEDRSIVVPFAFE